MAGKTWLELQGAVWSARRERDLAATLYDDAIREQRRATEKVAKRLIELEKSKRTLQDALIELENGGN